MTNNELIEKLKNFNAGLVVVDNKGREFDIKNVSETMGGQTHNVIELEEIEDPHDKWFRTARVYAEQLESDIKLHESEEFKKEWVAHTKSGKLEDLQRIIDNEKRFLGYVKTHYKEDDIVD